MENIQNLVIYAITERTTMVNKNKYQILKNVSPKDLTVAVIDLDCVAENYRTIESTVGEKVAVAAVVKADSYGFGAIKISQKLWSIGCRRFFVATINEAIDLRSASLSKDAEIYVLCGVLSGTEQLFVDNALIPVITNKYFADLWMEHAKSINKKLPAVIHVDTGMSRNGFSINEISKYHDELFEKLDIKFVMSHLACAGTPEHIMNDIQLQKFIDCKHIFGNVKYSLSATNGIFLGDKYHFDIVRPGKSLYGFAIRQDMIGNFKPVIDIYSRIVHTCDINIGDSVGYGSTFVAQRRTKTITIGMGYADGFMRKFSGFGHGFLCGKKIPIIGRISMDYIVLDATDVKGEYGIGDFVGLTSEDETLEKWALELNTIPHEIACRLGPRVHKIYIGDA